MFLEAEWDDEKVLKDYIHEEYIRSIVQNIDRKLCRKKPRGSSRQMEE
jgi:hypothetical protein